MECVVALSGAFQVFINLKTRLFTIYHLPFTIYSWRPIYLQQPSEITALENTQCWVIWALKNNYFDWLIDTIYHLPFAICHLPFPNSYHLPFTIHFVPFTTLDKYQSYHYIVIDHYHLSFTIYHLLLSVVSQPFGSVADKSHLRY
jgi:hypothetical protein